VLDKLPAELIAGDTWAWTRSLGNYPASTWTATVYFENAAATFNSAASASGTDHAFSIDAATTAAKKAGRYRWSVRVTDGTTAATVETGWVEVRTNPAAAGTSDPRSSARRTLDALNDFLEGKASNAQQSVTINGRSLSTYTLPELREWQQTLEARVRTEEGGPAAGGRRTLKLRFGRA
jgi:hypothetical protein